MSRVLSTLSGLALVAALTGCGAEMPDPADSGVEVLEPAHGEDASQRGDAGVPDGGPSAPIDGTDAGAPEVPASCDDARVAACDALGRVCEKSADASARCGACQVGLVSMGEACVAEDGCGSQVCPALAYCDILGAAPTCRPRPCPLGSAQTPDGTCAACSVASCEGVAGSTGRFWPFASSAGDCLCETKPGFFHNFGGVGLPIACDADGDGWTREEVRETEERGSEILRQNLRCAPASVVRVSLRDEYGLESHVWSCADGLVQQAEEPDCPLFPLRLLESKRNDVAGELVKSRESVDANRADVYGRRDFEPSELNALTKACATAASDYNDDGTVDLEEYQQVRPDGEQARLVSFSHFIELHEARFEAPAPGEAHGRLVIRERSRCNRTDLRLDHAPTSHGFSARVPETYWRTCYRRRDASFDLEAPAPGLDFAQWTLDPEGALCPDHGSCRGLAPAHADIDASGPSAPTPFGHGACSLGGRTPADGGWRGMHHHSQFKCVALSDGAELTPGRRRRTDLEAIGSSFNRCGLGCEEGAVDCDGGLSCRVMPNDVLRAGDVGFESVGYRGDYDLSPDGYVNGCINEDVEWPALMCGPFLALLPSAGETRFGAGGAFGQSTCDHWAVFPPEDDALACDPDVRVLPLFFASEDAAACNGSVLAP